MKQRQQIMQSSTPLDYAVTTRRPSKLTLFAFVASASALALMVMEFIIFRYQLFDSIRIPNLMGVGSKLLGLAGLIAGVVALRLRRGTWEIAAVIIAGVFWALFAALEFVPGLFLRIANQ